MTRPPPRQHDLKVEQLPLSALKRCSRNARRHSAKQLKFLQTSLVEFGVINPIIVDEDNNILAGVARCEAGKAAGMLSMPVIRVFGLTEVQKRAYRIADNRIAELAEWDISALAEELKAIGGLDLDFDLSATGFETAQIDVMLNGDAGPLTDDKADRLPEIDPERPIVARLGDLWTLGKHRLACGDARNLEVYEGLLDSQPADAVITDAPFNVRINGHVCGNGAIQHAEFAMATGEMSPDEYRQFLRAVVSQLAYVTRDGSLHYHFIDWRHVHDIISVGQEFYAEYLNLIVWNKTNGGMGSFYRSKHELIVLFRNGDEPHINNVQLGKHGRNRNNVWDYPGVNAFGGERDNLALHPTVKPVKMIEDAILDCSNRNDAILDPFCGSGTLLIAAERAGRRGFGIEIEPRFVDVALRRIRDLTGEEPVRHDGATLKSLE